MHRYIAFLTSVFVFLTIAAGCGSDASKGIYRDKDKPQPVDKEPSK